MVLGIGLPCFIYKPPQAPKLLFLLFLGAKVFYIILESYSFGD
jgi:hypothetical protein